MFEAVIFDVDGTIVDSVELHAKAWQDAFEKFGKYIDLQTMHDQIGKGGDQILPTFLSKNEIKLFGEKMKEYRSEHFKKNYLPKVKPFSRVRDLFQRIKNDGKKIGIGSSAHEDELHHYLKLCNVEDLADISTCADDADKSKPHPDIFEVALSKLGETPERTLVIGDSPYDAEAAGKISMRTIGFLCGGFGRGVLEKAGVIDIFESPSDLLQKYADSVLAAR